MSWLELGEISPIVEWQPLPVQIAGGAVFRVRQSFLLGGVTARLQVCSNFPGVGRAIFRSLLPTLDVQLVEMPISPGFEAAGLLSRVIEVKHNLYGRVYDQDAWRVAIDLLQVTGQPTTPTTPGTGTDPYSTDPGSYLNIDGGMYP